MTAVRKPKIGLLGLMLELYEVALPDLRLKQERFAQEEIVPALARMGQVTYSGIKNTREGVAEAMDEFIAADVDLIITVHFSYSPSLIALPELLRWSGPIVMFNTQQLAGIGPDMKSTDVTDNHGMHGVQDLANTLNRAGRDYAVVTGHYADPRALAELESWVRAAATAKALRSCRIGQVGFAFQDMGDFGVDETQFLALVGPHAIKVKLDLLAEALVAAPEDEVAAIVEADRAAYEIAPAITVEEHAASARAEWALRKVMADLRLDGFSIHYEALAADPRFSALPFAAASKLLSEGYGFGGEGDITSAAGVFALGRLCGPTSFTEMFTMDFAGQSVYMAHFAEANPALARRDRKPRLVRRDGWVGSGGVSTSLAFGFEPGPVTLINLTIGEGWQPKLIAFEAELRDFYRPDFDTPHCLLKPQQDLAEFLNEYSEEGGSHHLAMTPGSHLDTVGRLAQIIGINYWEM